VEDDVGQSSSCQSVKNRYAQQERNYLNGKGGYVLKKATLDESSLLLAPHRTMMYGVIIMPLSKQPLTHERVVNE
jgi:hypothetical protein